MHCHCGTNNRAPPWTFTDPCKPEVRPGAWEQSASPAWVAASAMNARDTMKLYIWRLGTECGPTQYRKCHSHNTPGKRHNKDSHHYIVDNDECLHSDVGYEYQGMVHTTESGKECQRWDSMVSHEIICSVKKWHEKYYKNSCQIKTKVQNKVGNT